LAVEPSWLDADAVIEINQDIVAATDEPYTLMHADKLEGALTRPINLFHYENIDDVATLTVSYIVSVAKAHAFIQGNKRTAFIVGRAFLYINGFELQPTFDELIFAKLLEGIVEGTRDPYLYEKLLRAHLSVREP
jgi:death-on-curing protein